MASIRTEAPSELEAKPVENDASTTTSFPKEPPLPAKIQPSSSLVSLDDVPLSQIAKTASRKSSNLKNANTELNDSDDLPLSRNVEFASETKKRASFVGISPPQSIRRRSTGFAKLKDVQVVDSDDLPLSRKVTPGAVGKLSSANDAKGSMDSDDLPLSRKIVNKGSSIDSDNIPLAGLANARNTKVPLVRKLSEVERDVMDSDDLPLSAKLPHPPKTNDENVPLAAIVLESRRDSLRRLSRSSSISKSELPDTEVLGHSETIPARSRSNSKSGSTSGSRADIPTSARNSMPNLWGAVPPHLLNDPAARLIAMTVTSAVIAQFEPWMAQTTKSIRELEKIIGAIQIKASQIEDAVAILKASGEAKNTPHIFSSVPKAPSPVKTSGGQYLNMSDLTKEAPSPSIMKNLPTALKPQTVEGPLLGNLEKMMQEQAINKVSGSLIYKTIVQVEQTKTVAVNEAARRLSEMPGANGEGALDIEPVPARRTCHRCEGMHNFPALRSRD
ncbi:hypothetical protein HDU97_005205 [Phlyctochytrium planicorne]|nr:hypothetical protein HDU97_005205 [Phlyctochytrium planicorne]